jgi:hypothetical protein
MAAIQLNITCSVATTGNLPGLCLTLSSILAGLFLPRYLIIRHEGGAEFSSFYLEQLIDLARFRGVDVSIEFAPKSGVRLTRTAQLEECNTKWLWIADDDVIYDHRFLLNMNRHMNFGLLDHPEKLCYLCGAKPDINARAAEIAGFSNKIEPKTSLLNWDGRANLHWGDPDELLSYRIPMKYPDTGAILIYRPNVFLIGASFMPFQEGESLPSAPGSDSLFGMQVMSKGGTGFFIPSAQALHLSKPASRFSEANSRTEAILASAYRLGVKPSDVADFPPGNRIR